MKVVSKIGITLVVIIVVLIVGRNMIVKFAIEAGAKVAAGVPVKIAKIDLGLTSTRVGINDLNIYNPKGFPEEAMFHAPEIFVDYKLGAMLTGKIHIEDIRLDFDKFVVVKNEKGEINLEALKPETKEGQPKKAAKKDSGKKKKGPEIQIDHLSLKVGTVIFKDYSKGGEPKVTEYKINISEEISNVMDAQALIGFIMTKALAKTALSSLGNFRSGAIDGALDASEGAVDTLKDTAGSITEKIKLPFGNKE